MRGEKTTLACLFVVTLYKRFDKERWECGGAVMVTSAKGCRNHLSSQMRDAKRDTQGRSDEAERETARQFGLGGAHKVYPGQSRREGERTNAIGVER